MHNQILKKRRVTRQIKLGSLVVGGDAPISVQTMTKTDTHDITETVNQILDVEQLGCDIVRIAIPDEAAARLLPGIRDQVHIPLVADVHFDHKLALMALDAGVDGLRINPGNIGDVHKVTEIVHAAAGRRVPIRIGVNSGSLEKDLVEKYGGATAEALVESAIRHVRILEDIGHREIKLSVKASDVERTVAAYRMLAGMVDYPLHLGVTEAGTFLSGTVRSSAALGILLAEGIGDTIRVSLTDTPQQETRVGMALLRSLGLREAGASVISCPTCGRTQIDVVGIAQNIESELERYFRANPKAPRPLVAVMGCVVNGPGEAQHADITVAGGKKAAALYVRGKNIRTVPESEIVNSVIQEVERFRAD